MSKEALSPVQIVALAGAVKDAAEKSAKASLDPGFAGLVDFKVRITGNVSKVAGAPGGPYETPATVNLTSLAVFCAVLVNLGIGPDRLRRALESVEPDVSFNEKLTAVFADVAKAKAAKLPPIKGHSPGTPAKVFSEINAELIP